VDVLVKLEREPSNPVDSRAVAIMCCINDVLAIVKEALDNVHMAIEQKKILKTQFDWIIVDYKKPGWYAGIMITRNGDWSSTVLCSGANSFL